MKAFAGFLLTFIIAAYVGMLVGTAVFFSKLLGG